MKNFFSQKLIEHLKSCGYSQYKLCHKIDMLQSNFSAMINGRRAFTDSVLEQISSIGELRLSYAQLKAWQLIDDQDAETIKIAQQIHEKSQDRSLDEVVEILTANDPPRLAELLLKALGREEAIALLERTADSRKEEEAK